MIKGVLAVVLMAAVAAAPAAAAEQTVHLGWIGASKPTPDYVPFVDRPFAPTMGMDGAKLAVADDNSSGKFLKQEFVLHTSVDVDEAHLAAVIHDLAQKGVRLIVADLPSAMLLKAVDLPEAKSMLFFNAGSTDDELRRGACRTNLLHTIPNRAMLTDALGQYLLRKSWKHWLVVTGTEPEDKAYLAALGRTAKRFGATVVDIRPWTFTRDSRHVAGQEAVTITQDAHYDVLVAADESGAFGDQLPFATWDPRPVVGTQGLVAAGWHPAWDMWGAEQLQNRFRAQFNRPMTETDFAAWEAVRAVGEAAMRGRSSDPQKLIQIVKAPDFSFAAYKGRMLSFRPWDGQLRQPIALAWSRSVVSVAPEDGFLHPETDLDTLGFDKGEIKCAQQ